MGSFEAFLAAVRARESGGSYQAVNSLGFLGAYQFGEAALVDLGLLTRDADPTDNVLSGHWTGRFGIDSRAEFLATPAAQDAAARAWFPLKWSYIEAEGLDARAWSNVAGLTLSPSAMLAGSHLLGASALSGFILSAGRQDPKDAYGTPISEYLRLFADYEIPFAPGGGTSGDTVYGVGGGTGTYLGSRLETAWWTQGRLLLSDRGGRDRLDLGSDRTDQAMDLAPGRASTVHGLHHGLLLLAGTVIEDYVAGSGDDRVAGNGAANLLRLGAGDDEGRGRGGDDRIRGEGGQDRLLGQEGDDHLFGQRGGDRLFGGAGRDRLDGGAGDDLLFGGAGEDLFVFSGGQDRIADFQDGVDRLRIEASAWGGGSRSPAQVLALATMNGGDLVLDLGAGHVLRLQGLGSVAALADDLVLA